MIHPPPPKDKEKLSRRRYWEWLLHLGRVLPFGLQATAVGQLSVRNLRDRRAGWYRSTASKRVVFDTGDFWAGPRRGVSRGFLEHSFRGVVLVYPGG